jgi:hypothetical protein
LDELGKGAMSSSTRKETKHRPEGSRLTVMVVGFAFLGRGRLQTMGRGSGMYASVKALPSQVKAKARVLGRLAVPLLLERRILRPPIKEARERFVQVPQRLLGRDTGDLIQPAVGWILLEPSQSSAGIAIEDVFPVLSVGIGAQARPKL